MYPKHSAGEQQLFLLSLLFMNLSFLTKHDLFKDKRVPVIQTYFQHHLAHVRIMNRGHRENKQINQAGGRGAGEDKGRREKERSRGKKGGNMKKLFLKFYFLDAQG